MLPIGTSDRRCVTPSERYLANLCERSFLRLWSHPNVFKKLNRELCDLLVIFGDDVIVFQDKSCRFKAGPHGWSRWYRHSILEASEQLYEAARWIRTYPSKLYLDARCAKPFPLPVPRSPRLHLVAVSLGASEACKAHFHSGSGSLVLSPHEPNLDQRPFHVGDVDRDAEFVHVFDDVSLTTVLTELDTIDDFVSYLRCKERFVRSPQFIMADGEEDLLAYYLAHIDSKTGRHDFVVGDHTHLAIGEWWADFIQEPGYRAKKEQERVSRLWDGLIDCIADGALAGTLNYQAQPGIEATEQLLRLLAREPRVCRRGLSKALMEVFEESAGHARMFRQLSPADRPDEAYVFAVITRGAWCRSEEHYREQRRELLSAYMDVVKLRCPHLRLVIGLAFGGKHEDDGSIDCLASFFDKPWDDAAIEEIEALRVRMEWNAISELTVVRARECEYPDTVPARTAAPSSNDTDAELHQSTREQ